MRKVLLFSLLLLLLVHTAIAQSASDVLENGVRIKSDNEIFLRYHSGEIMFQQAATPLDVHYKKLKDSALFLPVANSVAIYMVPMNPLKYTYRANTKTVVDPVDSAAASVINLVVDNLSKALKDEGPGKLCDFAYARDLLSKITRLLGQDQKLRIAGIFSALKETSFETLASAGNGLANAKMRSDSVAAHFQEIEASFKQLTTAIEQLPCTDEGYRFLVQETLRRAMKDLRTIYEAQAKRLANLNKLYLVATRYKDSLANEGWRLKIEEPAPVRGKNVIVTVKIIDPGYTISDDGEIATGASKEIESKTFRFRRFNRFVPEASIGFVHTDLRFPKYGTATDASGNMVVADAGEEVVKKFNVTAMLNYNWFISNSDVLPFWQIGLGVNSTVPTLLTGAGLRLTNGAGKRLAISFGLATTWIKTLDQLKVGSSIKGTADLEKDLKYQFNGHPKFYFGLQYHF